MLAPLAVRLTEAPEQIVGVFTVNAGAGLTVTDVVLVFEHPEFVPVIE